MNRSTHKYLVCPHIISQQQQQQIEKKKKKKINMGSKKTAVCTNAQQPNRNQNTTSTLTLSLFQFQICALFISDDVVFFSRRTQLPFVIYLNFSGVLFLFFVSKYVRTQFFIYFFLINYLASNVHCNTRTPIKWQCDVSRQIDWIGLGPSNCEYLFTALHYGTCQFSKINHENKVERPVFHALFFFCSFFFKWTRAI